MKYLFSLSLLVGLFFFFGCSNEVINVQSTDVSFVKTDRDSCNAEWNADTLRLKISWKQAAWKLAKVSGEIVKSVSQETGGSTTTEGTTTVVVTINKNTGGKSRSENLYLTNFKSNVSKPIKLVQAAAGFAAKITVDPSVTYQKITGFGGMLNPSWTGNNLTESDIQKLYGDLGYNIIRMMLYPNSSDWGLNTAIAKKAQSLGALVFATPWTPPVAMKSNAKTSNADGGYLLPTAYADYAAHLKAFVDYQYKQGLNLYAVSVQNEPNWKVDYDGCSWSAAQMLDFVKQYGDKTGAKLIAAEAVNNYDKSYTDALLNDDTAVGKFDIVATHLYGSTIVPDALAARKGKEFWMTEHCITDADASATIPAVNWTLEASLDILAKEIHDCMEANMNAYVWWYLKRYYSMIADGDTRNLVTSGQVSKRGYIMGHYAKYATGRTRIKSEITTAVTLDKPLLSTAYYGNKEITLVVINRSSTAVYIQFASPVAIAEATAVETTENANMAALPATLSADKFSAGVSVSAKSILSVRLKL